jgi:hypothetical protein
VNPGFTLPSHKTQLGRVDIALPNEDELHQAFPTDSKHDIDSIIQTAQM